MPGLINNSTNIFNKFSNVDLNSNKEFLVNAYSKHNTNSSKNTFNNNLDKKTNQKKKILAASFLGLSFVTILAVALNILGRKNSIDLRKFIQKSKTNFNDNHLGEKFTNFTSNIVNVKDDLWDKFAKKTKKTPFGFIDKIGKWITGVYKKGLSTSLGVKYNKCVNELKDLGFSSNIPEFNEWFNSTNEKMLETFQKKGERVTDNLFNKDILNKMSSSNIADTKIADLLEKEFIKTPANASCEIKNKIDELNKIKGTLLPKMRDINCGSAPTDLLTILSSVLGLGVATITADDKEERKSILINLGIPLIATLASSTYGTIKALTGAKALIFGLATGQIASISAKGIDSFIKKHKDKKTDV